MCAMAQKLGDLPLGDGHKKSSIINPFIASYLPIFQAHGPMGWAHPPGSGRPEPWPRAAVPPEPAPRWRRSWCRCWREQARSRPGRGWRSLSRGFWGNPLQNLGKRAGWRVFLELGSGDPFVFGRSCRKCTGCLLQWGTLEPHCTAGSEKSPRENGNGVIVNSYLLGIWEWERWKFNANLDECGDVSIAKSFICQECAALWPCGHFVWEDRSPRSPKGSP